MGHTVVHPVLIDNGGGGKAAGLGGPGFLADRTAADLFLPPAASRGRVPVEPILRRAGVDFDRYALFGGQNERTIVSLRVRRRHAGAIAGVRAADRGCNAKAGVAIGSGANLRAEQIAPVSWCARCGWDCHL